MSNKFVKSLIWILLILGLATAVVVAVADEIGTFIADSCGNVVSFTNNGSVRNGTHGSLDSAKGSIPVDDLESVAGKVTSATVPASWAGEVVTVNIYAGEDGKHSVTWSDVAITCPSTSTPTPTGTSTTEPSSTPTGTATNTPTPTSTSLPSATPTSTNTVVPTETAIPTETPTGTLPPTDVPTETPNPTATATAVSPTPTATATEVPKDRLPVCLRINFEVSGAEAKLGLYQILEENGKPLVSWYAEEGWEDSGVFCEIDISYPAVKLLVNYYSGPGAQPEQMWVLNPPFEEVVGFSPTYDRWWGWKGAVARGQSVAVEVAWPIAAEMIQ